MPRRPAIVPTVSIHTMLPASLATRLQLHLWSEVESRVPKGAIQAFFIERLQEFFTHKRIDLAPYLGTAPGEVVVSGTDSSISRLTHQLQGVPTMQIPFSTPTDGSVL